MMSSKWKNILMHEQHKFIMEWMMDTSERNKRPSVAGFTDPGHAVRQCGAWLSSKILGDRLDLVLCPFVPKTTVTNPFCSENCEEHSTKAQSLRYFSSLIKCASSWESQEVLVQAITHKSRQYYGYFCSHAFIKGYIRHFKPQEQD